MTYHVVLTRRAARWLSGTQTRLAQLAQAPTRWPLAAESEEFPFELREIYFGLGQRPTHRAIFTVAEGMALVLAVRHLAQDHLQPDDLSP